MAVADTSESQRVGEIIEATAVDFGAQCYQLYELPRLGALVRVGFPGVYGVVIRVTTEPLDPSRPVLARGELVSTEDELYRTNPQLARLLTSRFKALIVGFSAKDGSQQYLPPLPPRIHSFIYICQPNEVVEFSANLDFLHMMVHSGQPGADEVVGACLREMAAAHSSSREFLLRAGKALAVGMASDLPRLNAILRSVAI
jgi:hypothetical protein